MTLCGHTLGRGAPPWHLSTYHNSTPLSQLTNHEAFGLLYLKMVEQADSRADSQTDSGLPAQIKAALTSVAMRPSASPVVPQLYRSFFVGVSPADSTQPKGSKTSQSQDETAQNLSVSYQALSNGRIWWWHDSKDMKEGKEYIYGR